MKFTKLLMVVVKPLHRTSVDNQHSKCDITVNDTAGQNSTSQVTGKIILFLATYFECNGRLKNYTDQL